jgi:hypothetical protein
MPAQEIQDAVSQIDTLITAAERLPLATILAAALAFRPRRRGTPARQSAVVQTQIILAIVGAVVMFVVGSNLARAFGIVGAAGLIRYRAKIEDPKDAGVMLATLGIGLACGVGLWAVALFSTLFIGVVLLIVESMEAAPSNSFSVKITSKGKAIALKQEVEGLFHRNRVPFELLATSEDELCFDVKLPPRRSTEGMTRAILALNAKVPTEVKWEKKKKEK